MVVKALQDTKVPDSQVSWWQRLADVHVNFCPHGNWFFLPWHRAYLHYLEQVASKVALGGKPYALPYWDWTLEPRLPAPFLDASSPLFVAPPDIIGTGGRVNIEIVPPILAQVSKASIDKILKQTNFDTFGSGRAKAQRPDAASPTGFGSEPLSGVFESGPHNGVHASIGGTTGLMGTMSSPLDPIFWLHHANVDRIWAQWAATVSPQSRVPSKPPVKQAALTGSYWLNYSVGDFVDASGKTVKVKISDLMAIGADSQIGLNYTYDSLGTPANLRLNDELSPDEAPIPLEIKLTIANKSYDADSKRFVVLAQGPAATEPDDDIKGYADFVNLMTRYPQANARSAILRVSGIVLQQPIRLLFYAAFGQQVPENDLGPESPYYLGSYQYFQDHRHHAATNQAGGEVGMIFDLLQLASEAFSRGNDMSLFDGRMAFAVYGEVLSNDSFVQGASPIVMNEENSRQATANLQLTLEVAMAIPG